MSKRIILLQALSTMPNDLALVLTGLTAETAVQPGSAGYAIADVLHFLLTVETQTQAGLACVLAEERPLLDPLPPAPTPQTIANPLDLPSQFRQARGATLDFLQSVSAGGWQRPAIDPQLGETTFRFLVQRLVNHDTEYLNHLIALQQQIKKTATRNPQPALQTADSQPNIRAD